MSFSVFKQYLKQHLTWAWFCQDFTLYRPCWMYHSYRFCIFRNSISGNCRIYVWTNCQPDCHGLHFSLFSWYSELLKYKKDLSQIDSASISAQLLECATTIADMDSKMQDIKNQIYPRFPLEMLQQQEEMM